LIKNGETPVIVRLHNLSARPPALSDLQAVVELQAACERADVGVTNVSAEELEDTWHMSDFVLRTDAWVIVTKKGQIVGYAEVRRSGEHQLTSLLRVHPAYLGRGIGTLLVWLTEERARHLMHAMPSDQPITLSNVVSNLNPTAQHLLQREGYTLAQHYWNLLIRTEDGGEDEDEGLGKSFYQGEQRLANLVLAVQNCRYIEEIRTGIYTLRQYQVFAKELRGACLPLPLVMVPQGIGVKCINT
jgi:GNAT superfamily N-acetyltransferase